MEITLVKAAGPGEQDRAYLEVDGITRRGPVHVMHDLPHLVVESRPANGSLSDTGRLRR